MADAWFKPKTHGYGASPANWKGWAATLLFTLVVGIGSALLMNRKPGATQTDWLVWGAFIAIVTILFVAFARFKSNAPWRWRWGETTVK